MNFNIFLYKKILGIIILILIMLGWFFLKTDASSIDQKKDKPQADEAFTKKTIGNKNPILDVHTTSLKQATWPSFIKSYGNIAPRNEISIGSELPNTQIIEVNVEEGDWVTQGQKLAKLDQSRLSSGQAVLDSNVSEAKTVVSNIRKEYDRIQQLFQEGFYSQQRLDQVKTELASAQSRLDSAKARRRSGQVDLANTYITAPQAGIISVNNAAVGELVKPGKPLFHLISEGRLQWSSQLMADDFMKIKPGQKVYFDFDEVQELVIGSVRLVSPTIDPKTRTGMTHVDLPKNAYLRPGMYVKGAILLENTIAFYVPEQSIVLRDGFSYLFQVNQEGHTKQVKVDLGRHHNGNVELIKKPGSTDAIVSSGVGFLSDGDFVRIIGNSQ